MHGAIHLFDRLPQVDPVREPAASRPAAPVRAEPLVGLIRNPHSHRNESVARKDDELPGVMVAAPARRSELTTVLVDFADKGVDYIAIDGGDGTVRDIITCGASVFGEAWPGLILLPSGKTNALAHDLGLDADWDLAKALEVAKRGELVVRRPLVIAQRDNERAQVHGFVLGAGVFNQAIAIGQHAHDFGAFNTAVVAVTLAWATLRAFVGGRNNPLRRGTPMRLRYLDGQEIEHAGCAPPEERFLLFATSLEHFPAGLDPFRQEERSPAYLAVLDSSRMRLLLRLGSIFRGTFTAETRRLGFHTQGLEGFEFDIADHFILDGEAFPPGSYRVTAGPRLRFVAP